MIREKPSKVALSLNANFMSLIDINGEFKLFNFDKKENIENGVLVSCNNSEKKDV